MGPPTNASKSEQLLRLSQTQTNLLQTLDALDAQQLSSSKALDTLQRKYDKLKMKCTAYLQCMNALEAERDVLKDVVQELIAKVERNNGTINSAVWHPSRILVHGRLARSLQPQIHQQLALSSRAATGDQERLQANAIIRALQAQLENERRIRLELEERLALLEAMVARRDVELQQILQKPLVDQNNYDLSPSHSVAGGDFSKVLDAQSKRNKELELEIATLRSRLDNDLRYPPFHEPNLPRQTHEPTSHIHANTMHAPVPQPAPYSASLQKLKSLGQLQMPTQNVKRNRRPSPPLAQIATQIDQIERDVRALQGNHASSRPARVTPPPVRPVSAPPGKPTIFVELEATIETLGREIEKMRIGRDNLRPQPPVQTSRPISNVSSNQTSPLVGYRSTFTRTTPTSPKRGLSPSNPSLAPETSRFGHESATSPGGKSDSTPVPPPSSRSLPPLPVRSDAAQLRHEIEDLRQQKATLVQYAEQEGFLQQNPPDATQEEYVDASTLRPNPQPVPETDDTVSELGLDLTFPQSQGTPPEGEEASPTQTFFPHRSAPPNTNLLQESPSFNTDSIDFRGTDPPTRHEEIWSDLDPDGERSMELATPLVFSASQLRPPSSSESEGEQDNDRPADIDQESETDDDDEISEATIPLPPSPPGDYAYTR